MTTVQHTLTAALFASALLWGAEHVAVNRVQLAGPMGSDNGHLVLASDQLIFVDDKNPQGSFSVPRTDVRALALDNGVLTITMSKPFTNMYGQRSDIVVRVNDPSSPGLIASWVGLPVSTVESSRVVAPGVVTTETRFNVTHDGDAGVLVVGPQGVSWQDAVKPDRSRTWSYAQIKRVDREDNNSTVKIKPHDSDEYKFKINRGFMNEALYDAVVQRLSRGR